MGCLFSVPDDGHFDDDERKAGTHYDSLSTASGIDDTSAAEAENECMRQESSSEAPVEDLGAGAAEEYFVHDDQWCRSSDADASAGRDSIESVEKRPLVLTLDDVKQTVYGTRVLVTFAGSAFGIPLVLHTHWQHGPSPVEVATPVDDIQTGSVPESILSAVLERVREHMEMCQRVANRWNPNSELNSLCRQACSQEAVRVTPQLFALLQEADRLHRATGGRYDPTRGALWRLFRDKLRAGELQSPLDERRVVWENVGWSDLIHLDESGENHLHTAKLSRCGAVLDLDGLLKGWIVDQIDQCLRESFGKRDTSSRLQNQVDATLATNELRVCWLQTATEMHSHREVTVPEFSLVGAFVDWGSEIRTWGEHPSGRKWRTLVIRPPALERLFAGWQQRASPWHPRPQEAAYSLTLERAKTALGLATSGDYFQMERFGFYHIVSPLDKCIRRATKDSIASVTVLAGDATTADAFATAAMTFQSAYEAAQWLERQPQVLAFCILTRSIYKRDAETASAGVFVSPPFEPLPSRFPRIRSTAGTHVFQPPDAIQMPARSVAKLLTTIASCCSAAALVPRPIFALTPASGQPDRPLGAWVALVDTLAVCSLSPPRVTFHIVQSIDPLYPGLQHTTSGRSPDSSTADDAAAPSVVDEMAADPQSCFHMYLLTRAHQSRVEHFMNLTRRQGRTRVCGTPVPTTDLPVNVHEALDTPMLRISVHEQHPLSTETHECIIVANVHQVSPGSQHSLRILLFMQNQLGSTAVQLPTELFRSAVPHPSEALRLLASSLPKSVAVLTLEEADRRVHWAVLTSLRWSACHESSWLSCNIQKESKVAQKLRQAIERRPGDSAASTASEPILVGIQLLHGRSTLLATRSEESGSNITFDTEYRTVMPNENDDSTQTRLGGLRSTWLAAPIRTTPLQIRARPQDAIAVIGAQVCALYACDDHEILIMQPCAAFVDESHLSHGVLIRCNAKYRALRTASTAFADGTVNPSEQPVSSGEKTPTDADESSSGCERGMTRAISASRC